MSEHIIAIFIVIITGAISIVGLVLSKENKISEFRQLWINDLRDSLSKLGTNFHKINRLYSIYEEPTPEDIYNLTINKLDVILRINNSAQNKKQGITERIKSIISRIIKMKNKIFGRGDDNESVERDEEALVKYIEKIYTKLITHKTYDNNDDYIPFIEKSSTVLKKEWERVKTGELTYRIWSFIFSSLFIMAIVTFFAYILFHFDEIYRYITTTSTLWGG